MGVNRMLPNEIVSIIHEYRTEFERVENEILGALSVYYGVEDRASELLEIVGSMNLTDYYLKNLKRMTSDVMLQCCKLVSDIVEEETITPVQQEILKTLAQQIENNHVFQILFHPLCSINLF
jgi:hypothetical protein